MHANRLADRHAHRADLRAEGCTRERLHQPDGERGRLQRGVLLYQQFAAVFKFGRLPPTGGIPLTAYTCMYWSEGRISAVRNYHVNEVNGHVGIPKMYCNMNMLRESEFSRCESNAVGTV